MGVRPERGGGRPADPFGYVSVRGENAVKEIDFARCRLTGRMVDLGEQVDTL